MFHQSASPEKEQYHLDPLVETEPSSIARPAVTAPYASPSEDESPPADGPPVEPKSLDCEVCHMSFTGAQMKADLTRHLKGDHNELDRFLCRWISCHRTFEDPHARLEHERRWHSKNPSLLSSSAGPQSRGEGRPRPRSRPNLPDQLPLRFYETQHYMSNMGVITDLHHAFGPSEPEEAPDQEPTGGQASPLVPHNDPAESLNALGGQGGLVADHKTPSTAEISSPFQSDTAKEYPPKWHCGNCGDGPYPSWLPVCGNCGLQRD